MNGESDGAFLIDVINLLGMVGRAGCQKNRRRRAAMNIPIPLRLLIGFLTLISFCGADYTPEGFIRKELRVDGRIQSITLAEFNGDSRPDIAIRTSDALNVVLNAGAGDFSPSLRTELPYGFALAGVTDYGVGKAEIAADFNADGKLDLAIRDRNEILFGAGDGTFLPPYAISGEFPSLSGLTAAEDFDGDSKVDLVFFARGSLAILLGDGDGKFRLGSTVELGGDGQVIAADLDRDGRGDLVYLRYHYPSPGWDANCCDLQLLLTQPDGTFVTSRISGVVAGGVLVADFNADGIPDIATINAVLLRHADGTFQNRPRTPGSLSEEEFLDFFATPSGPAAAADLDGDGNVDLITSEGNNAEGRTTAGFHGRSDGTFLNSPSSIWFHLWEDVIDRRVGGVADLDGDGRPDVVTAVYCPLSPPQGDPRSLGRSCPDPRSNNLAIFLNRTEGARR